jgi:hypothetical protein
LQALRGVQWLVAITVVAVPNEPRHAASWLKRAAWAPAGPRSGPRASAPFGCYAVIRMFSCRNSGATSAPFAQTSVWNSG